MMNLIKRISLLFLLLTQLCVVNAQNLKADSLEKVLKNHASADTTRVNLLNELAYTIYAQDAKKAKHYADEAGKLANRINYVKGQAACLWVTGLASLNDSQTAIDYFEKALTMGEKAGDKVGMCNYLIAIGRVTADLGDIKRSDESYKKAYQIAQETKDQRSIMKILYHIAQNLSRTGDYLEAMKQLQEVIRIGTEVGDRKMLSSSYGQLAFIHARQANHPVAIKYYLSALKINEELGDKSSIFYNLNNIAGIQGEQKDSKAALKTVRRAYALSKEMGNVSLMMVSLINLGNLHMNIDQKVALDYFEQALALDKGNIVNHRIAILMGLGSVYTNLGGYDKALASFEEALELAQKIGLKRACGEAWCKIGVLYFTQKQYSRAISYTQQALQLANELKLLDLQKDSYKQLAELYSAAGAFDKAYSNHVAYKVVADSIFNEKNVRQIAFLESSYEYDKERQISEMEKANQKVKIQNQRRVILFLIVVSVLVLLLAFTIYWTNKLKKRVLNLEIANKNHELEINQKAMTAATLKLMENSERDTYSIKMLENIKKNTTDEGQNDIRTLIAEYKMKSYNSNWNEFEILFEKTNSSFYEKLNECYPTLTPNERKLCVFLKLNMSSSHISQVTFQSEEALKKARLRLRKKLELDRDTNLTAFIQSL